MLAIDGMLMIASRIELAKYGAACAAAFARAKAILSAWPGSATFAVAAMTA
jgi:hypothetical protein